MLNNRRFTAMIVFITVASVFLCSCGNALPIDLDTSVTGSKSGNNIINVNVLSNEDISNMVEAGPSLILVYMVSTDSIDFTVSPEIQNLNENYWQETEFCTYPLFNPESCETKLFTYTDLSNTVQCDLMAFRPVVESLKLIDNFDYYLNFNKAHLIYNSKIQTNAGEAVSIPLVFEQGNDFATIRVNNSAYYYVDAYKVNDKTNTQHVYVFAGVTAEGLNNYVSDLSYVGEF